MPSLRRPAPLYIPHESIHLSQVLGKLPPCLHHFDLNHLQHLPLPEHVLLPIRFRPKKILEQPEVNHLSGVEFYQLIPFEVGQQMCLGCNLGN